MKLSDNTILITGGATGIGLAFAKKFVELGNKVIITGRRQDKLDDAVKAVPGLVAIRADVADPKGVAELAKKVIAEHPALNVLMNNAGVMVYRNLGVDAGDLASLTSELDINLAGPIRMNAAFMAHLKSKRGAIINVSSGLAFVPLQAAPIYCATKAALHSYTISLRQQLAGSGVEVIELAPPAVKTELADIPDTEGITIITTDVLIDATIKALRAGEEEIRVGQSNQLHWMSRIAPGFINGQLAKGSAGLVPAKNA
ncbi:MAG: SDR family NAD(P)-dependent oxidoreductase [Deltaproteobacteria bacterium]|nr:SDR family NAD(P)-dependent oxidoreductase [Deltaproteobacteria bacterium]